METLINIAQELGFKDLEADLHLIEQHSAASDCALTIPLVGEFSSGKTTLINALTDSKALETATRPTTATIYTVHFGHERCHARVVQADGSQQEVDDLSALKNEVLSEARVVEVFDTSKQVSPNIVLVDTPGLSSPDPRHKQVLVNFLPQADAVLLVSDINQQLTRSITDFLKEMELSHRPVYLVLTKSDTKSAAEVEAAKVYIRNNSKLSLEQMVCVSGTKGDVEQLLQLLQKVQQQKGEILQKVNAHRRQLIVQEMRQRIDTLLQAAVSDQAAEQALREQELQLRRLERSIDRLVDDVRSDVEEAERATTRNFEDRCFERLDTIVAGKSQNYDAEAVSAINSLSALLLNDYKQQVLSSLQTKANQHNLSDAGVNLRSLSELDLSQYAVDGLSYNLSLNEVGHEYDGMIGTGVKVVAAAAAVAVAVTAGAAGAAGAAGTAVQAADMALDAVDTVSDVGSIISNSNTASRIERAVNFASKVQDGVNTVQTVNQQYGQQFGAQKGLVEGLVGWATDKAWGKPQRRRAIHDYLTGTLLPAFQGSMHSITANLLQSVSQCLKAEAAQTMQEMTSAIAALKAERQAQDAALKARKAQLKDYQQLLAQ